MSEDVAFRSSHPDVLAVAHASQTGLEEWNERVKAFIGELPDGFLCTQRSSGFAGHVLGIVGIRNPDDRDAEPGRGWRYQKTWDCWVPDKRVKAGKTLERRLRDDLTTKPLGIYPGMPSELVMPGHWYSPASFEHDGVVYVRWDSRPGETVETNEQYDAQIWERCPLSVFWAAHEAKQSAVAPV